MAENPPAWHPDPTGKHDHRWWDGQRWTEHVADAGVAAVDPLPAAPPGGSQSADSQDAGDPTAGGQAAHGGGGSTGADPGAWSGTAGATGTGGGAGEQPVWAADPAQSAGGAPHASAQETGSTSAGQQAAWPGSEAGGTTPAWAGSDEWGQAGAGGAGTPTGDPTKTSGLAVTALVLGMLAIPSAIVLIGGLFGIVAIILGAVASGKAKRGETGGRGIAIGGIITGSIGLVIAVGLFITVFSTIAGDVTECIEETGDPEACQAELERDLMDRFG